MHNAECKAVWEKPELVAIDVTETREGIPFDAPEGTVFSNPNFGDLVTGS
ncbi:MAG: hypothetical protein AAGA71_06080 [Pseudomonadota bacterium]